MKRFVCLLLLIINILSLLGQETDFITPFAYNKQSLASKKTIESDIHSKEGKIYDLNENVVAGEIKKLKIFNESLEAQKDSLVIQTRSLQAEWSNVTNLSGLQDLRNGIQAQLSSKASFQNQFEKNIQNQSSTRGVYLVVLPAGEGYGNFGSQYFKVQAQQLLASKAVKELNDVFISSVTTVIDRSDVQQRIKSKVKGVVNVVETPFEKRRLASGDYILLLYVNVSPLSDTIISNGTGSMASAKYLVNCKNTDELNDVVKKLNMSSTDVDDINQRVNEFITKSNNYNQNNERGIQDLWLEFNKQIYGINLKIEADKKAEQANSLLLEALVKKFYPNGLSGSNLNDTINKMSDFLKTQQNKINNSRVQIESKRLFLMDKKRVTLNSGLTPNEAIAENIFNNALEIEKIYGNKVAFTEEISIENKQVTELLSSKSTYRYGGLKKLWVYITPTNNDEYILNLIANLDIVKNSDTSAVYNVVCTNSEGGNCSGGGLIAYNANTILSAAAQDGYTFSGWYENGNLVSSNNPYSFKVQADRNLTAKFQKAKAVYNVSIVSNYTDAASYNGAGNYEDGSTVNISVDVSSGYSFDGWYENGILIAKTSTYSFVINGKNREFKALFSKRGVPNAYINQISVSHNQYYNGERGMKIYVNFSVNNMKGYTGKVEALIFCNTQQDCGIYADQELVTSVESQYTPSYVNASYNSNSGLMLFLPYSAVDVTNFSNTYFKFQVKVYDDNDNELTKSGYSQFEYYK